MGCEFCEKPIPDNLAVCPYCGRLQSSPGENDRRMIRFAIACVLAVLVLVLWRRLTGSS